MDNYNKAAAETEAACVRILEHIRAFLLAKFPDAAIVGRANMTSLDLKICVPEGIFEEARQVCAEMERVISYPELCITVTRISNTDASIPARPKD